MFVRTDPFRELDRITHHLGARPTTMPMDAYRKGQDIYVQIDLPGTDPDSIDVTVEKNVLTVKVERPSVDAEGAELIVRERPSGSFTRRLFLGEALDAANLSAGYVAGVLTITIPVREAAKPRKVEITAGPAEGELAPKAA
jgi:HSP20 family protein